MTLDLTGHVTSGFVSGVETSVLVVFFRLANHERGITIELWKTGAGVFGRRTFTRRRTLF